MSLDGLEPEVVLPGPPSMSGGFHAWNFDLDLEVPALARLLPLLSVDEIVRANRFQTSRDRARYVAGRCGLRQILGHCLGLTPTSVQFTYSSFGKPALVTRDGKSSLHFNASGSGGSAIVAVHPCAAVGIDIERVRVLTDLSAIAGMLLSESEHGEFAKLAAVQQAGRIFDYWTRKEALAKALGTGLRQGLDQLSLHPWPGQIAQRVESGTDALWVAPLTLQAEGYVAALASVIPVTEVRCERWDLQQAN